MQGKCPNHCTISLDPRDLNLLHIISNGVDFLFYQVKHLPIFKLFPWNEQLMESLFLYAKFCWIPEIYSMCKPKIGQRSKIIFWRHLNQYSGYFGGGWGGELPSIFSQVCQQLKGLGSLGPAVQGFIEPPVSLQCSGDYVVLRIKLGLAACKASILTLELFSSLWFRNIL